MITGGAEASTFAAMMCPQSSTSPWIYVLSMPAVSTIWLEVIRNANG